MCLHYVYDKDFSKYLNDEKIKVLKFAGDWDKLQK